jgi:serine/threonine protein kinase
MALSAGSRLGPYEILASIGAGGMGEVYRARDTRLKREVALKVLPDSFASDQERLARFQREAEVLASLNHPNIAQIYGVEERALVMELVGIVNLGNLSAVSPPKTTANLLIRSIGVGRARLKIVEIWLNLTMPSAIAGL